MVHPRSHHAAGVNAGEAAKYYIVLKHTMSFNTRDGVVGSNKGASEPLFHIIDV